jgi:hypothetical protein
VQTHVSPIERGACKPVGFIAVAIALASSRLAVRPWRGLGRRPNLPLLPRPTVRTPGITHRQHQSREAGSSMGPNRQSSVGAVLRFAFGHMLREA